MSRSAVAGVLLGATFLLWLVGVAASITDSSFLGAFNLDVEFNFRQVAVAPVWSAALLFAAAAFWWLAASGADDSTRVLGRGLALFLLLMSADEFLCFHERLEHALGIDWQTLYAPLIAAGGATVLCLAWRLRSQGSPLPLLLVGSFVWATSQLLEKLQWDGDMPNPGYGAMMAAEELLENVGSVTFILAAHSLAMAHRESTVGE